MSNKIISSSIWSTKISFSMKNTIKCMKLVECQAQGHKILKIRLDYEVFPLLCILFALVNLQISFELIYCYKFININMTEKVQSEISFEEQNFNAEEKVYGITEYLSQIWDLGLITFGGPMSHIGIFRKRFVQNMNCIKDQKFVELLTICQSLPGPTSTQLLTAISMYATTSFAGGMLVFVLFSLPAFVAMFSAVIFLQQFEQQFILSYVLPGLRVVAVAVIFQAFVGLFKKIANQYAMMIIVIASALIYYFYRSTLVILLLFAISGVLGLYFHKVPQTKQNYNVPSRFNGWVYGLKNLIIFFVILLLTVLILPHLENALLIIFFQFYKIGSLVIGGGHVILPIMNSEFKDYNLFTEQEFYNGFSLISIMPGPMFNLCVYVGGIITHDIWGSLSAFCGLYLPCILFVLFILPFWQTYRKQNKIKSAIAGVCSASIGLILTASIILYEQELTAKKVSFLWFFLLTTIITLSYGLLHYNFSILIVFFLGDIAYIGAVHIVDFV